jgi:hypothetical protein
MNSCRLNKSITCNDLCKKYHRCPFRVSYFSSDKERLLVLTCSMCGKLIGNRENFWQIGKYVYCESCYEGLSC